MQKNLLIAIPFILLGGASYIFHVIIQQWMKWCKLDFLFHLC